MFVSIMKKGYPVILTQTEREQLKGLIAAGTAPARKLTHARILLKADQATMRSYCPCLNYDIISVSMKDAWANAFTRVG